ncbi:MAG: tyrosine-type recombinase/integrase [Nitrospira sp. CR1.1]|jgi:integrase|nr:tyrosine-type recombinase/integrase [Nitrospira sp. CR1.1]
MDARNLLRVFYPVMRKAEVKTFRCHDLRHTFATRLVQAGVDIYTVQKLGRWKTISMVMRYAHHHPESLRAGVEILDRVPLGVSTVGFAQEY